MKKQHKTYILLIAVLIVWGIIGFQIFNYLNPQEEELPAIVGKQQSFGKMKLQKETYTVQKHSRDPFLGKMLVKSVVKHKKKKATPVVFPNLTYHGLIESGKRRSYIVSVNGVQSVLRIGQKINDIKLLSGNKKEIRVHYKGTTKKIPLS